MSQVWFPEATKDVMQDSGNWLVVTPWRGVLHTTEGDSYAGARAAYLKGMAPHFTVSFETGAFKVWQHVPLNRAARALAHPAGTVETNRTRCVQIEIVAHAASVGTLVHPYLDGLGHLMRWIEANTEIPRHWLQFHGDKDGIVLARDTSPIRLSPADWLTYSGWLGHQHVPVNDHWDPGAIDIEYLMQVDRGVAPMYDPPIPVQMVAQCADPDSHGGWILDHNGGVLAIGEAVFYGTPFGKDYFANRTPADIKPGSAFTDLPWKNYKYVVIATNGDHYGFPS